MRVFGVIWAAISICGWIPFGWALDKGTHADAESEVSSLNFEVPARKDQERLQNLCADTLENRLWNLHASDWAQFLRRRPQDFSLRAALANDLRDVFFRPKQDLQMAVQNAKAILDSLDELQKTVQESVDDFSRTIERDFGDLQTVAPKNATAGIRQSLEGEASPSEMSNALKIYGVKNFNSSPDPLPDFDSRYPVNDLDLGNVRSLEKFNFFLGSKYGAYSEFIKTWDDRLNHLDQIDPTVVSPRNFTVEYGAAIGKSRENSRSVLNLNLRTYTQKAQKSEALMRERQVFQEIMDATLRARARAQGLVQKIQKQKEDLRKKMEKDLATLSQNESREQLVLQGVEGLVRDGQSFGLAQRVSSLAHTLKDLLRDHIPEKCSPIQAAPLSDMALYEQKLSSVDPNRFVVSLIQHAREVDPSCVSVDTGNIGGNSGDPAYRKLFVAAFLRDYCAARDSKDVRFKTAKEAQNDDNNDALRMEIFRSDRMFGKLAPEIQREIAFNGNLCEVPPQLRAGAQAGNFAQFVNKPIIDNYALLYALGQRETGSDTSLPGYSSGTPETQEIGLFHTSLNTLKFMSPNSQNLIRARVQDFYEKIADSLKSSGDLNEVCRIDARGAQYANSSPRTRLAEAAKTCRSNKGSFLSCLGTLVAYCPTATLFYESFVVREARQNHGPLLIPGDKNYARVPRPAPPVPACSTMFMLLAANSHFLCDNLEITANYDVDILSKKIEDKPAPPVKKKR